MKRQIELKIQNPDKGVNNKTWEERRKNKGGEEKGRHRQKKVEGKRKIGLKNKAKKTREDSNNYVERKIN